HVRRRGHAPSPVERDRDGRGHRSASNTCPLEQIGPRATGLFTITFHSFQGEDSMLTAIKPNVAFSRLASDQQIERAAHALEANGIHTLVAANGEAAKEMVFDL